VSPRVIVELDAGVAVVTLNRPDQHNALDLPMFERLSQLTDELRTIRSLRAVVLAGNGPSFCAGLDVAGFGVNGAAYLDALLAAGEGGATLAQRVVTGWASVPVPVIAAVHGNCLGGGLQLALGADIRVAEPDSKLSVLEIRWGLIPDMAITWTLPGIVGYDTALELATTGRMFTGAEAHALGMVTSLSSAPLTAALDLARTIAGRSPDAVRAAKLVLRGAWSRDPATLLAEAAAQRTLIGSPNQAEAVRAATARSSPAFGDPAADPSAGPAC